MNCKKCINKIKTYGLSFLKGKKHNLNEESDVVVLLFFGRIGDAVMFLDALDGYKKLYIHDQHKKIVFACRNEVLALLKTLNKADDLDFIEINREKLASSYAYFIDRVKAINSKKPKIILNIRENHIIENVFVHSLDGSEKLIYRVYPIEHNNKWSKYFSSHTYTMDLSGTEDMDHLTSQADLLRKLGLENFKSSIPALPKFDSDADIERGSYVCLCPGASVLNKCWPIERYSKVIDYIHENSKLNVVICGGKAEQEISSKIISGVKDKSRVFDFVGKSDMKGWIALIQNSAFVVCNESASVHLAACSDMPAICIGEQKFGDKWLPYRPEVLYANNRIPVMVRSQKLPCSFCAKKNFERDIECKKCFAENGVIRCVYEVTEQMITDAIGQLLKEYTVQ